MVPVRSGTFPITALRIIDAMKDALFDAIRNTFNFDGRTNRRGFWSYVLIYFSALIALLQAERSLGYRLPGWVWSAYIVSTSAPFVTLFFRRWHDISCSARRGVFGVALIAVFYIFLFDPIIPFVLLYFSIRLSKASSETNRYGPKPVGCLTTVSGNRDISPNSADHAMLLLIILVVVWLATTQRSAFLAFMIRHTPSWSLESVFDNWMEQSLRKKQNLDVFSMFRLKINKEGKSYLSDKVKWIGEETHVLFLLPDTPIENIACPGYSSAFVTRLGVYSSLSYALIAFDSSGLLSARKLNSSRFCKGHLPLPERLCLKLNEAVFVVGTEKSLNNEQRTCFKPVLASRNDGY
jgi:uncharacterized membrane protein YhaH (DUF805 family)